MSSVILTYGLIREMEEQQGLRLIPGTVLTYRAEPRFPWFHSIFDLKPGTRCRVIDLEYDPCEGGGEDYDSWDNHYYYHLEGLEEHGGICTTELFVLFDCEESKENVENVAVWMRSVIDNYKKWPSKQPPLPPLNETAARPATSAPRS